MGACCSNRLLPSSINPPVTPRSRSRLKDSLNKLSQHHQNLSKLNFHLNYFQDKAMEHSILVENLLTSVSKYRSNRDNDRRITEDMSQLLGKIETEVMAQYHSEIQSTDTNQEDSMRLVQTLRANIHAANLTYCHTRLSKYISSKDGEHVRLALFQGLENVKKTHSSLLCYVRFVEDAKSELKEINEYFEVNGELTGDDKIDNAKEKIEDLRVVTGALITQVEMHTKNIEKSLQQIETTLEELRRDFKKYTETDNNFVAEAEKLQTRGQLYLSLVTKEKIPRPSKPSRRTTSSLPVSPLQKTRPHIPSFSLLKQYYREHPVDSSTSPIGTDQLYTTLIGIYVAKAEADSVSISNQIAPDTLEGYLLNQAKTANGSSLFSLSQLLSGLERLSSTPLATLSSELFSLIDAFEPISLHEEVFLTKAIAHLEPHIQEEKWPLTAAEKWECGGLVRLETAFTLIQDWFYEDIDRIGAVITSITQELSQLELSVAYIIYSIKNRKMTPEDLFRKLDIRRVNNLRKDDFEAGIRSILHVNLPAKCLNEVSSHLDKTNSNCIFRSEFLQLFQTENSPRVRVSRLNLVNSLRKTYKEWKAIWRNQLYLEFVMMPLRDNRASKSDIDVWLRRVDSSMTPQQRKRYIELLVDSAENGVTFEVFWNRIQTYPVGTWAKSFFCNFQTAISDLAWMAERQNMSTSVRSQEHSKVSSPRARHTIGPSN